jgi:hypothetical protein
MLNLRTLQILAMTLLLLIAGASAGDVRLGWKMRTAQGAVAVLAAGVIGWVLISGRRKTP